MPKEHSPYFRTRVSVVKLGALTEELSKLGREIWINMAGKSTVRLMEGAQGTIMGPMPNWKARWILEEMLKWERKKQYAKNVAVNVVKKGRLFVTA